MARLDDLKRKRAELEREIAEAEKADSERLRARVLARDYVAVACPGCDGLGAFNRTGSDNTDVNEYPCDSCAGHGFLYGRIWTGNRAHDMDHNQVGTP